MKIVESLEKRRSYYSIGKDIADKKQDVIEMVKKVTELVPDAFNMKSSRVVVAFGEKHDLLWDEIYNVFGGKVDRAKIDSFKAGYGTILYFVDEETVKGLQGQFELYADRFPLWANQSAGMLQISIWSALREMNIGASLQHYNPVIDEKVRELFDIPQGWVLNAQMPFGNIVEEREPKEKETIENRVKIIG